MKNKKYRLVKAFNPKRLERGFWSITFVEKGKPLFDKYIKFFQLKAKNRKQAIQKARKKL